MVIDISVLTSMNESAGRRRRLPCVLMASVALLLSACLPAPAPNIQPIPTSLPTPLADVELRPPTTPTADTSPTPDLTATPPPAIVLPDSSGVFLACEANTLRVALRDPSGQPFAALTRLGADETYLYVVADGGLYRVSLESAARGEPVTEAIFTPGQDVAGRPVQELVDVEVVRQRGLLYVLDKAGHVFRTELSTGQASLVYRATSIEEDPFDAQPVALTSDPQGRPVLLDESFGRLVIPSAIRELESINESTSLQAGVDVTRSGNRYYVLTDGSAIRVVRGEEGAEVWLDVQGPLLSLALKTSDHLGVELLYLIDGLRREVTGLTFERQAVTRTAFVFPGMGLLRDAVFAGERLYAIADGDLYVHPGPQNGTGACAPPALGDDRRPRLFGVDVLGAMSESVMPVEGEWELPPWARLYPGASRLYRSGVHEGLDLFGVSGPRGFQTGWPVLAAMDGRVTRASIGYVEMTEEQFDALLDEADRLGYTPDETLVKLSGKQIVLEHDNGLRTVYLHLDEIAPGVVTGARVRAGQLIGTAGVTGTEGEVNPGAVGAHLHFEIWVGDYYLGYGMTIREAMWWYAQIFGE